MTTDDYARTRLVIGAAGCLAFLCGAALWVAGASPLGAFFAVGGCAAMLVVGILELEQRTAPRCPDCYQRIRRNESHVRFYQRWGRCHDCQTAVRQRAIDELRDIAEAAEETVAEGAIRRQCATSDERRRCQRCGIACDEGQVLCAICRGADYARALEVTETVIDADVPEDPLPHEPPWRIPYIRVPDMLRLLVAHGYRGERLARAFNISAEEIEALTEPEVTDPYACAFCRVDAMDCGYDLAHGLCDDCRAWYSALLPSNDSAQAVRDARAWYSALLPSNDSAQAEARRQRDSSAMTRMVDDINRMYTLAQAANIPPRRADRPGPPRAGRRGATAPAITQCAYPAS